MLIGEFVTSIGDKNRVVLPRVLQQQLNSDLVITRGYERSLIIVDSQRWTSLVAEINRRPLLNLNVRDTKRFLLGGAHELSLDKQGRFVIPETLRTYADIGKQISLIGVGEWLEIWNTEKWQLKLEMLAEESADVADRLSEMDIHNGH